MPDLERVKQLILDAEAELGPLSYGQKSDLLLDNFSDINGSPESHRLLGLLGYRNDTIAMVRLKNGAEEAEPLCRVVVMGLTQLFKDNPIALYELTELCRDRGHKLFGNTGEVLAGLALVENGCVHESVRNIVLSAMHGQGLNLELRSPLAEASTDAL